MISPARLILAAALTGGAPLAAQPGPPPPPDTPTSFEYAVKAICGRIVAGPAAPLAAGNYHTAVNIHNPGPPTKLRRKVAVAAPGKPGKISVWQTHTLANDEAMEIDCPQISKQLEQTPKIFVKGFLVIQSYRELDIVAVYPAGPPPNGDVATLHTERVPPRTVPLIWPPL